MIKKYIMLEENEYIEQYHTAIYELMNGNDIHAFLYPLINLIHQVIEIEVKSLIAESYYDKLTMKELKIDNTHDLKRLIENNTLRKYYEDIEEFEQIFDIYKRDILYFYSILGNNGFLNSRYPIERNENEITTKNKDININEFYNRWTSYCENYRILLKLYVAYSIFNTVCYLRTKGLRDYEIEKIKVDAINESTEGLEENEKNLIYLFIDKFIIRNKYIDFNYVQ